MDELILKLLASKDYAPVKVREMLRLLGLRLPQLPELEAGLASLERAGQIVRTKGNRYIKADEADLVAGTIRINRQGKGFVQPEGTVGQEIVIPESATDIALHGDRVLVRRDVGQRGDDITGAVVRILERHRTQIVGTFNRSKNFFIVSPDDPRIPHDIYVPPPRDVGRQANIGDKVVVELREWTSRNSNPEGEIIEVLGAPDAEGVDMLSVLRHYNLPLSFPKDVLAEAEAIAKSRPNGTPTPEEIAGRVDCRAHNVVTIDPDDAKDFDDAICLQRVGQDRWKLWVHIADVSHYVQPGNALDKEASSRGNSTYLVDRVIPMLPEALSNELCSLKPNVDRLTKCVEFQLSNEGRVLDAKFYSAVIHSKRRFTYKEVFAALQSAPKPDPIDRMLRDAHELAQRIRRARFQAGSLDLDFPENKIRLDEHGKILRIERIENDFSHQLIEEYMLLANEAVAARLMQLKRPVVYRIHESPKERKLADYRQDILGHNIPCGNLTQRGEVQKLLAKLGTLTIGPALKIGFLRSLMRAQYSTDPLGHYGLAKAKYTHFTSPIRRYSDLIVHRVLFDNVMIPIKELKEVAEHISETERNSADAERDSKDVKLYAWLRAQLESGKPEKYPGLVTDVRNFGFFVDVTGLGMSGLVPLSTVEDDFFVFDPIRHNLVGRRTRRVIKLGDKVTVQVAKVDSVKKQVDFRLATTGETTRSQPQPQRERSFRENRFEENRRPQRSFKKRDEQRKSQGPNQGPQPGRKFTGGNQQPKRQDQKSGDKSGGQKFTGFMSSSSSRPAQFSSSQSRRNSGSKRRR